MPEALILEFAGVSEAEYGGAVNKHLGIDMQTGQGDWPAGLLSPLERPTTARSSWRRCGPRGLTTTRS